MDDFWKWHEESMFKATAPLWKAGWIQLTGIEKHENDTEVVYVLVTWNFILRESDFEIINIEMKDDRGERTLSKARKEWTKKLEMMKQIINKK